MNSDDVRKVNFPLSIVVALLSTAITAASAWAVASERLKSTEDKVQHLEARQTTAETDAEAHRLRTQRLEDAFTNMSDMVKEIRQDVKELRHK